MLDSSPGTGSQAMTRQVKWHVGPIFLVLAAHYFWGHPVWLLAVMLSFLYAAPGCLLIASITKAQEDLGVCIAAACMIQSLTKLCRKAVPAKVTAGCSHTDPASALHDSTLLP